MEHEITFPLRYLRAARLFAAKEDIRHYLKGVAISRGHIVGCNGFYVGAIRCGAADGVPEVILPNEAVDFYLKKIRGWPGEDVTVQWGADRKGRITNHAVEERFDAIDGRFPQFESVLCRHTAPSGNPQFQWSFLTVFEKAAEALGVPKKDEHKAYLLPNGDDATARVIIPGFPEFEGAVSPLRPNTLSASRRQIGGEALV